MKEEKVRKKEGFEGQKAIIIPRKILTEQCTKNEIMSALYITDIGYYPRAQFHYRERIAGADQHILIYCFEGNGSLKIRKNDLPINPGDFFIIPAKIPHTYFADESNPWTIYWIHFKGKISDAVINLVQKQTGGYKGFIQYSENSIQLFNEMYNQMERGYSTENLMYSNMCLWHFLTSIIYNNKYSPNVELGSKDEVDKAIDYLRARIDQTLTLEDIAGSVNLSASHFSYLFKKKTGFSPIEYFNHLKVQKACQYLLFTNLRMKQISLELGISDPYYFSRMFTKVMGMSPSEYKVKRIH